MPFIKAKERLRYNELIDSLVKRFREAGSPTGHANYIISRFLVRAWHPRFLRYEDFNRIMGLLICVLLYYFIRWVIPYERLKKRQQGDIL